MTLLDQFRSISTFVLDVDGVLTDGTIYLLDNGEQVRSMNIKDGFALQLAIKKGYRVLVISGGQSLAVVSRLNRLGITDIHMGATDKKTVLEEYMKHSGISAADVLFMGDDIPDYEAMKLAGVKCAPVDAAAEIKEIADYIASRGGGQGCVREVIEKVLKLRADWELNTDIRSR